MVTRITMESVDAPQAAPEKKNQPSLTLSVGGVDFVITTTDNDDANIGYSKRADGSLELALKNVTGSLVIVHSSNSSPPLTKEISSASISSKSPLKSTASPSSKNPPVITPGGSIAHNKRKPATDEFSSDENNDSSNEGNRKVVSKKSRTEKAAVAQGNLVSKQQDDEDCVVMEEQNDTTPFGLEKESEESLIEEDPSSPLLLSQTENSSRSTNALDTTTTPMGQPEFSQTQTAASSSDGHNDKNAAPPSSIDNNSGTSPLASQETSNGDDVQDSSKKITLDFLTAPDSRDDAPDEKEDTVDEEKEDDEEVETTTSSTPDDDDDFIESKENDALSTEVTEVSTSLTTATTASSLTKPKTPAPSARWGHTWTSLGDNKYLLYGGQGWNTDKQLPETRKDVAIYNAESHSWCIPFNCEGIARQWHTSTYLPERGLVISFGGEAHHGKRGKTKTTDQVMVLDTEIMLWYPPTVSGTVPSGRSGHTATLLNNNETLVVIGGVQGQRWISQVSVLDTNRWVWTQLTGNLISGSSPKPRSYHSATAIDNNRIVVFGGNNAQQAFDSVHVLEQRSFNNKSDDKKSAITWRWSHPTVRGRAPRARTGHSAVLLDDNRTICVYGGWDPIDDTESSTSEEVFGDAFLLDTQEWTWKKLAVPFLHALPNNDDDDKPTMASTTTSGHGPMARVGHGACKMGKDNILLFGGRVAGGAFIGDLRTMPLQH